MAITFRYKEFDRPDGQPCVGPYIPLTIKGQDERMDMMFLLDSGADYTVIPIELAELLGVDLSGDKEQTSGVGGVIYTRKSSMMVEIKNAHEKYNFKIPIHIILKRNSNVPPLLGRETFFDKFQITFNQKDRKIILKRAHRKVLH